MPERTCAECAGVIPWQPRRKYCEPCALEVNRRRAREFYYKGLPPDKKRRGDTVENQCRYCEREFTYVLFSHPRTSCEECAKRLSGQARARWAKEHPERIAEIKKRHRDKGGDPPDPDARFRRHGVTREWYLNQIRVQKNRCANSGCRTCIPGGRHGVWHIDHDHVTGQVRGLLCNNCNIAAGYARDDPAVLVGLSRYIAAHRQLRLAV